MPDILYNREGRIAHTTLNRPDKLNATTADRPEQLSAAVQRANADDDVRVLTLISFP